MSDRLTTLTQAFMENVLALVRDHRITNDELHDLLAFLTDVGRHDEFQLLADVLGLSVAVDNATHAGTAAAATAHNVEGPFYRPGAPWLSDPARLASHDEDGDVLWVSGQVQSARGGGPVPNAMLDVWQANARGRYENEDPAQADYTLRGRLRADDRGRYRFRTVAPAAYEVDQGGPVGRMLRTMGRHAWRPAHIHLKVEGEGYEPLTTMLFVPGDRWLASDAIGAVKAPLVMTVTKHTRADAVQPDGSRGPFQAAQYDFVLVPKGAT